MLLVIAFACFFVMFAIWLIVPNIDESSKAKTAPVDAPVDSPVDSNAMPARA